MGDFINIVLNSYIENTLTPSGLIKDGTVRGINYPIVIKKSAGLPLRTYHWEHQYSENIVNAQGVAETVMKSYCFKFGEKEWLSKKSWEQVRATAEISAKASEESTCPIE